MYILLYMQAIWAFESPDQRFLRLHQVGTPTFADAGTEYQFTGNVAGAECSAGGRAASFETGARP